MTDGAGPLPRLRPDDLDPAQRELYEAIATGPRAATTAVVPVVDPDGTLAGPFNALLFAPELGQALQRVGAQLRYGTTLTDRERELATLYVAGRIGSSYELFAHRRLARAAGLNAAEVDECALGQIPVTAHGREPDLLRLADALCTGLPSAAPVRSTLDDRALVEVTILVGYYRLLAGVLEVAGVQAPPDESTNDPK